MSTLHIRKSIVLKKVQITVRLDMIIKCEAEIINSII